LQIYNVFRSLIKIRVSQERRLFCQDGLMLNPKDSSDQTNDLKSQNNKGNIAPHKDKRVLEIGL
jgi:hypothetical protein